MDFTVKNLYQFFYQGLLAKLSPLGFSKKGDSIVKTMQNEMVISFYVSIANYDELKMVSVGFWFGNILTHKLWVIFQISVGGREIEDYNPSQFKVAMQVKEGTDFLYEHVILPKLDNIWSYEDAEKYLNFINKYLLETWIPYMQEIDTIEKLEYEVNEGRHLQISITPSVYATIKSVTLETNYMLNGLILAKLVSDEQYILRRAYYVAKDIKDMKDLNCETSEEWTNALIFFDKYSREDLLKMVVEYDEKYLKSPKKSKKLKEEKVEQLEEEMDANVIIIKGFDSDGEPEIRKEEDGSLTIAFNFMPPLNGDEEGNDDEIFDRFDEVLSDFLAVKIDWEDREFFIIKKPKDDTTEKIKDFLENFWKKYKAIYQSKN